MFWIRYPLFPHYFLQFLLISRETKGPCLRLRAIYKLKPVERLLSFISRLRDRLVLGVVQVRDVYGNLSTCHKLGEWGAQFVYLDWD
jgi:hypothetical protein